MTVLVSIDKKNFLYAHCFGNPLQCSRTLSSPAFSFFDNLYSDFFLKTGFSVSYGLGQTIFCQCVAVFVYFIICFRVFRFVVLAVQVFQGFAH